MAAAPMQTTHPTDPLSFRFDFTSFENLCWQYEPYAQTRKGVRASMRNLSKPNRKPDAVISMRRGRCLSDLAANFTQTCNLAAAESGEATSLLQDGRLSNAHFVHYSVMLFPSFELSKAASIILNTSLASSAFTGTSPFPLTALATRR